MKKNEKDSDNWLCKSEIVIYRLLDLQDRRPHLGKIKFLDEIASIKKEAKKLKETGVNIILVIGQSGSKKETEIATKIFDIDVVVAGKGWEISEGVFIFPHIFKIIIQNYFFFNFLT